MSCGDGTNTCEPASAIFSHRYVRAARHIADLRDALAPQPRRDLLEEIVVDEPNLLQAAVL
jgi:hypothetical protein